MNKTAIKKLLKYFLHTTEKWHDLEQTYVQLIKMISKQIWAKLMA